MAYRVPDGTDGGALSTRPVLPGQNTNNWRHNVTGELGVYSNWSLQSATHLLEDAPLRDHVPGAGDYPHGLLYSQMFTGAHSYAPMEVAKFSHGGQKWSVTFAVSQPWQLHNPWEYHGVPGAEVFGGTFGYTVAEAATREFTFSRYSNYEFNGVPSADPEVGQPLLTWDAVGLPSHAYRHAPYEFKGVGEDAVENPGETDSVKYARAETGNQYAFQRVNEWQGVPSSKAL